MVEEMIDQETQAVYNGQINKKVIKQGWGTQTWPDGGRYEGEWFNNQANGKGKFWHVTGDIYQGNWVDDKANGFGVYDHVDGARYIGEWKDDKQEGYGNETFADGSNY